MSDPDLSSEPKDNVRFVTAECWYLRIIEKFTSSLSRCRMKSRFNLLINNACQSSSSSSSSSLGFFSSLRLIDYGHPRECTITSSLYAAIIMVDVIFGCGSSSNDTSSHRVRVLEYVLPTVRLLLCKLWLTGVAGGNLFSWLLLLLLLLLLWLLLLRICCCCCLCRMCADTLFLISSAEKDCILPEFTK